MNTVAGYSTEDQNQKGEGTPIGLRRPVPGHEDMIVDDIVLWTEDVYEEEGEGAEDPKDAETPSRWRWLGRRTIKGLIEWGFAVGPAKTRVVHVRVQASTGCNAIPAGKRIPRTVSKLQRCKIQREAWDCEVQRAMARRRTMSDTKMAQFRVRQVDHLMEAERPVLADCTQNTLPRSVRQANAKNKKAGNKKTKDKNTTKGKEKTNSRKRKKSKGARPGQYDWSRPADKQVQASRKNSKHR